MENKKIKAPKTEEVLALANAAYDKHQKEQPNMYPESSRIHFVHGWLISSYTDLYNSINS